MAVGTFADDVAVGQELVGFLVVVLLSLLFNELALIVEFAEEVRGKLLVRLGSGTAVDIKTDTEVFETSLNKLMVAVANVLRCHAFFFSSDGDGYTVFVTASDEDNVIALQPKIAHVDVGRHINTGQMTDMHAAIGIRQCCRDKRALIILMLHKFDVVLFTCKISKLSS